MAQNEDASNIRINLSLKRTDLKVTNVFFKWAISVGKLVLMITWLITFGALAYRFVIDRQLIDLHDQIKREDLLIKAQENKELEYRNIQARLAEVKLYTDQANFRKKAISEISEEVKKQGILADELTLDKDAIVIQGNSPSVYNLGGLINDLKKINYILSIDLGNLDAGQQGVNFSINIKIGEK